MPKQRRYSLKTKEARQVIADASNNLKMDLEQQFGRANMEVVESEAGDIYLIAGKPLLFKTKGKILPTLHFSEFVAQAPKVVVDMGAVPYVCKGATVMAPGIVRVDGEFAAGDFVVVTDMKFGKALGVGEAQMDAETMRQTKKGPTVKTLHWVSDRIWETTKIITE